MTYLLRLVACLFLLFSAVSHAAVFVHTSSSQNSYSDFWQIDSNSAKEVDGAWSSNNHFNGSMIDSYNGTTFLIKPGKTVVEKYDFESNDFQDVFSSETPISGKGVISDGFLYTIRRATEYDTVAPMGVVQRFNLSTGQITDVAISRYEYGIAAGDNKVFFHDILLEHAGNWIGKSQIKSVDLVTGQTEAYTISQTQHDTVLGYGDGKLFYRTASNGTGIRYTNLSTNDSHTLTNQQNLITQIAFKSNFLFSLDGYNNTLVYTNIDGTTVGYIPSVQSFAISPVPLPAGIYLFLSGLVGLVGAKLRGKMDK